MRKLVCAFVLLAAGPSTAAANSGTIHQVAKGETYADIAERFYGRRYLQRHLKALNRLPEPLKTGTPIIIPTLRAVPVTSDQTLRGFAEVYLQDPERDDYLKVLNRLKTTALKAGQSILVSQSLRHVVRPGETWKSLARTYYRSTQPRRIRLLRLYNKKPRGRLRPQTALRIPLDAPVFLESRVLARANPPPEPPKSVAAASATPPPSEAARPRKVRTRRRRPSKRAQKQAADRRAEPDAAPPSASRSAQAKAVDEIIERAERELDDGDYAKCLKTASDALAARANAPIDRRVELLRIKATALIALDRSAEAKATFESLLKLDKSYQLDLYYTSPKILHVFQSIESGVN